ncbi:MAG: hypothetical protein KDE65_10460 [Burkholderiaceae bacterium]|nr:hypothetical protein [Burkholderiaceae bacterium]
MANSKDSKDQIFQFILGPVQGFVAQARRTRDFWAGSFILSWLSSVAIAAIQKQGGEIQFPVPDAAYMRNLSGTANPQDPWPQQGSIPNRFMATTAKVPADFHPEWVSQAVQAAWAALAQAVWAGDLPHLAGTPTEAIWQRQVGNFWEISWVLSDGNQPSLIDQRKNWRSPVLPQEPGHKCMVMDGWQELSGINATSMAAVNGFWGALAASGKPGIATDLGEAGRDPEYGEGMLSIENSLSGPTPLSDPYEPNDDIRWVNGSLLGTRSPLLWRPGNSRYRIVTATLSKAKDPADVYRVKIPARRGITVNVTQLEGDVVLSALKPKAKKITRPGKNLIVRSNRPYPKTEGIVVRNLKKKPQAIWLALTPSKRQSGNDAAYRLKLVRR